MADAPITLYIDLHEGQVADIEVVARAAIAWSHAIKELAFILDPGLEVRVELRSGDEGSLGLNSLIKAVNDLRHDPVRLRRIALAITLYFTLESRDWLYAKALDLLTDGEPAEATAPLSDDQISQIVDAIERGAAKREAQQVYKELERDPAVKGVGVTTVPGARPAVIIPSSEFRERAGFGQARQETVSRRVTPDTARVALIKPVLVEGSLRRWSLLTANGEFGFVMKDADFTHRVLTGTTNVPLMTGIEMDVEIETVEELKDGVWTPTERSVTRVINLYRPDRQGALAFDPPDDDSDRDNA